LEVSIHESGESIIAGRSGQEHGGFLSLGFVSCHIHGPYGFWVFQEAAFAQDLEVVTDAQTRFWEDVREIIIVYSDRDTENGLKTKVAEMVELSMAMMGVRDDWRMDVDRQIGDLPISELLFKSNFCGGTESKDKIFTLLSQASDVETDMFEPDYRLGWDEICVCLTRYSISQSNTLDVLRCVGLSGRCRTLSSGILDWSVEQDSVPLKPYN
jgi:hypothetical protein